MMYFSEMLSSRTFIACELTQTTNLWNKQATYKCNIFLPGALWIHFSSSLLGYNREDSMSPTVWSTSNRENPRLRWCLFGNGHHTRGHSLKQAGDQLFILTWCFFFASCEYIDIFKVATVIHSQSSTQRLKAVAFPACPALHFGRSRWIRVNWCQFDTALFDFTKYMQGSLSSSSSSTAFNLHYSYLEGVPSMVAVCLWCLYKLQTPSLGIDGFNLSNSPAKSLPAKAARPWEALHWKH